MNPCPSGRAPKKGARLLNGLCPYMSIRGGLPLGSLRFLIQLSTDTSPVVNVLPPIGGNTFTTGDVSVLNWIKNLKLPNGRPPRMDMYGHNPFNNRAPFFGALPLGHGFIDFPDLPILGHWIDTYLGRPRHHLGMKIFIAEL